jgi:lipid II:glycine glycyltransferase (peptidoglycan interpeptide bridge formation enzyme)
MSDTSPYINSVFEQPWWLDTVAPGKWGEVFVKESDRVIARFPYVLDKQKLVMPPLTQTLGPWIHSDYRKKQPGNTQTTLQKEIIKELLMQLPKHKSFDMTFDSNNTYILPYRWSGYSLSPSFSYRLSKLKDLDVVYENFNKTVKKNIRSANNKIQVYKDLDPQVFYKLLSESFKVQNRTYPHSEQLIKKIFQTSLKHNSGYSLYAKDELDNMHATAFIIGDERVHYYLLGGTAIAHRNSGAQNLLLWEAIRECSVTSESFDFEGSMVEGIENFFRQFGGDQVINYNVSKFGLIDTLKAYCKPKVKKLIGYKL